MWSRMLHTSGRWLSVELWPVLLAVAAFIRKLLVVGSGSAEQEKRAKKLKKEIVSITRERERDRDREQRSQQQQMLNRKIKYY